MKKETKIFIFIFIFEIMILLAVVLFSGKTCSYPTPCVVPDFFHPFGRYYTACIQMLTPPMQCNLGLIYSLEWLLILTIFIYLIIILIKSLKGGIKWINQYK